MEKAIFDMNKTVCTRKQELNLRRELIERYIWSIALLYGAER
jgi:hypothetical protein